MIRADQRIDAERFRGVLEYALRFDVPHDGSLLVIPPSEVPS